MGRKNNRGGGGGGGGCDGDGSGQTPFCGTGSLSGYNRVSGFHNAHENKSRFGRSGDGSSNRPHGKTRNNCSFKKFRDPLAQERGSNSNKRSQQQQRRSNGSRRPYRREQNFGNEGSKDKVQLYGESGGTGSVQNEQHPAAVELPAPADKMPNLAPVIKTRANSPAVPTSVQTDLSKGKIELEDKKPIINIKQEKIKQEVSTRIATKQPSSSSSSSESSESGTEMPRKPLEEVVQTKLEGNRQKSSGKPSSPSSSSSSSSDEDECSSKAKTSANISPKTTKEKLGNDSKEPTEEKLSSEEDLICLGKLKNEFVIEDDPSEESEQEKCESTNTQCLICDNQGHTAFECQMICKNCAAPYHNMKNCPKPANLSIMLQSFMEFCMGQMSQFNPEQKFLFPRNYSGNENTSTRENLHIGNKVQSKKVIKARAKSKERAKKSANRKRRRTTKSSDEEEEETDSVSESDSSIEVAAPIAKKKRRKVSASVDSSDFRSTFVPPFSTFPAFGAAAAAYNPLLLGQLMHSGGFGKLN